MAKVFLSHSSADKGLVSEVYRLLGDRLAEYDAKTFEAGLPNWEVIVRAFERCDVFALIATSAALDSKWVRREIGEARRRLRDTRLKRMLVFVADGMPLSELPGHLREFAIFLTFTKPKPIELAIKRHLLEISSAVAAGPGLFVGRDRELGELKALLLDPAEPVIGACVSGLPLQGRAGLIVRAMQDINPSLFPVARTIDFHIYESCADLALSLHGSINEQITPEQVAAIRDMFVTDEPGACGAVLYKLVQDTALEGQFPIFADRGGIISHSGSFSPLAQEMIDAAASSQDLRIFFVTTRRPVPRARANTENMVFYDVRPMEAGAARQYVTLNARKRQMSLTAEQVDLIIETARGDVPVLDLLLHNCKQYTPELALADVNDAREVGRERAAAFIHGAAISDNGARLLGVLNNYFNVPAEFIGALFDSFEEGLAASAELLDQHLVVEGAGIYSVSPPLADAVARDERFRLGNNTAAEVAKVFTRLFDEYRDENAIPVGLIDAGSIAAIEHGSAGSSWASQFLLPSHYIYLARRSYDRREYERSIEFCEAAIGYRRGLTTNAYVYACRTLGMSAARRGKDDLVTRAVSLLNGTKERLARGYASYVLGFNDRLLGRFGDAQSRYEEALKTLRNDVSLLRELASVSLLQRETQKAIGYGERALVHAQTSPYILDIVARARILAAAKDRHALQYDPDIKDILRRLENACAGKDISLFELREAEYRLALGDKEVALSAVEEAVRKTPDLAAPYLMRARIHLAAGRTNKARSDRDKAKELTRTARGRHRYFDSEILRVELEIATKSCKWAEAVALFEQMPQFQQRDQSEFQRRIVVGIDSDRTSLPPHVRKFTADYHARTGAAGGR